MITGSKSDGDSPGSTKDPSSSQDAPSQDAPAQDTPSQEAPAQDAPVDDAESSEAKAASTNSPAKNLNLAEGKARAQPAKATSQKRANDAAAADKKRAALDSPPRESDPSDEGEEEGAVTEPQGITNDLDVQQERNRAAQLQDDPAPPTPVYPHGYYPPDAGSGSPMFLEHLKAPRGLNHGRTSRSAYERALVQVEPLFVNDIEAARCVLLAPHRIPLNEFTSLRNKWEGRGGLFTVWGYPWVQPENTTTQTQAEDLFWRWVSLKNFTVQELKELREDRLLSYVLDHRDLRIVFAHVIAKRQLHSVMEGLRHQSKSGAQDERGYGSVNPGTVHRKAAKKPRTTYAPAVDPKSQQPLGSQPGAGLPAPTSSVTRVNTATSQAAGVSQSAAALGRPAPHGCGARRSDQGGQEELSHAFEYEAPSQPYPSGPSTSGRDSVGSLLSDEVRQLQDRVYAIEIALGPGPGELHGRVDHRAPASALKELRRGLDALSHEVHGRMPSYEPQGYSYHSAYGYGSYPSSSHYVPSYPSYDSRGYQPVYQSQASTPAAPVDQRT
ncbi:Hypothetical protein PHPALM_353 [Phytophthora palmivora]|uniref:ATP-binding cassette (ABC) Superfamily n=1 Tax=Phytophthora palmivora TaxID=4796 RepID=A0A2P4YV57_9STRA|nr:Hypothetical protein PHPALM_353 [Phytophthora palmivora]